MRHRVLAVVFALLSAVATAQSPSTTGAGVPQTDEEKTLYAVGLIMERSLRQFDLSPAELAVITRAIADAKAGKPAVELDEWGPKIQELANLRGARIVTREKETSAASGGRSAARAAGAQSSTAAAATSRRLTGVLPRPSRARPTP